MRTRILLIVATLALTAGCASTPREEKYGAVGAAAGYALCSGSQALVGLCVIGGAVLGSEIGANADQKEREAGKTKCRTHRVGRWTKDNKYVLTEEIEDCDSEVERVGYRKY